MNDRKRGLGRGLGALIPTAPVAEQLAPPAESAGAVAGTALAGTALAGTAVSRETGVHAAPTIVSELRDPVDVLPAPRHRGLPLGELVRTEPEPTPLEPPVADPAPALVTESLPGGMTEVPGARFAELPIDAITPNPRQPREVFDEEAMAELVHSISEVGLLQPIVVRQIESGRFELIMGERRWRASREAGLEQIPAIVRDTADDRLLLDALLENLHRSQLNPLEEAAAYDQLLKDFSCTHEELAERIGRSRSQVSNTLRLMKLPPSVQRRVAAGVLSAGHARALLALEDPEEQEQLANRIVKEGLSVRAVEEIVSLGEKTKVRKPRAGRRISPVLHEMAGRLSDRFETRVRVDLGQKRGKIVVEFASMEDLERIVRVMAPEAG
jgi:ParB family transcriptional regulator, chromosome partitioning protein